MDGSSARQRGDVDGLDVPQPLAQGADLALGPLVAPLDRLEHAPCPDAPDVAVRVSEQQGVGGVAQQLLLGPPQEALGGELLEHLQQPQVGVGGAEALHGGDAERAGSMMVLHSWTVPDACAAQAPLAADW